MLITMKCTEKIQEAFLLWLSLFSCIHVLTGVARCDLVYLFAVPSAESSPVAGGMVAAVAAIVALWGVRRIPAELVIRCLVVWVGMVPFLLLPKTQLIYAAFALVFFCGWSVCRLLACCGGGRMFPQFSKRHWLLLLTLLILLFIGQGLWLFRETLNRLLLFWEDWGIFNEVAWNTLQGRWLQVDVHGGENFFGDHFMPGFFLWFTPLLGAVRSPFLLPVIGALCLWGSAGLIYLLARRCRFSPAESFCCGLVLLFNPVINNLNLSGMYGTHVISFFIPLLLLFYCLRRSGHPRWAFAVFLFSLTVKESVAVFWIGWSLCMMLTQRREWRKYVLSGGIALGYFLLVTQWIIPSFSGGYRYEAQYAALGGNMLEMALSPLLRPAEFWGRLAQKKNLLLLLFLLSPVFLAVFRCWRLIPAALLLVVLNMLRGNPEMVNFLMHHNTECAAFLLALCVTALAERGNMVSDRLVFVGIRFPGVRRKRRALLGGVLVSTLMSYWFFAQGVTGAANLRALLGRNPDCSEFFPEIRSQIRPGACFSGDSWSATVLMLRNRFVPWGSPSADYYLYGTWYLRFGQERHRKMLRNPEYSLAWMRIIRPGMGFWLFRRGPAPEGGPQVMVTEEAFANFPGYEVNSPDPAFQIRVHPLFADTGKGEKKISFLIRRTTASAGRSVFLITLSCGQETQRFRLPRVWRGGNAGELFEVTLQLPAGWNNVTALNIAMEPAR